MLSRTVFRIRAEVSKKLRVSLRGRVAFCQPAASSFDLWAILPDPVKADAYFPRAHIDSAKIDANGPAPTFFDLSSTSSTYDRVRKPMMLACVSVYAKISGKRVLGFPKSDSRTMWILK